jgi:hypothetical protein
MQQKLLVPVGSAQGLGKLILVWLVCGLLTGCSMVQSSMWTTFVDDLGTGSKVVPERMLIDSNGVLNVRITKAANPKWVPGKDLDYPYAGVMMFLRGWGKPMDISESDELIIEYRLSGKLSLKLKQKDIPAGREYLVELEPSDVYITRQIPWSDFSQPSWVQEPVALNLTEMIGLVFTNTSEQHSSAELSVRNISFSNWENPDYPIVMIKKLFQSPTGKND